MNKFDVIVIGGGFCGTHVAKMLERSSNLSIALFDTKNCFEYLPSLPRVAVDADYYQKIIIPYASLFKRTKVFTDRVVELDNSKVVTKNDTFYFRYAVIATGASYPIKLENKANTYVLKDGKDALQVYAAVQGANKIIVVGGGLIGTELAAEIVTNMKNKQVTIIEPSDRLLSRNSQKASNFASRFLSKRDCKIICGQKVISQENGIVKTDRGMKLSADIILWCGGIACDSSFLSDSLKKSTNEKKCLLVGDTLQVTGHSNIFCGGDISAIPEEKTAQNAESHGVVIAHNILALEGLRKALIHHKSMLKPMVISVGKWNSIFVSGNFVFSGLIPAIIKKLIEIYVLFRIKYW